MNQVVAFLIIFGFFWFGITCKIAWIETIAGLFMLFPVGMVIVVALLAALIKMLFG